MPIPRRNPRDSLTRSPSDWTQLRSVDTERTTEARRSLVSPPDSCQLYSPALSPSRPIMADSPMYTLGRMMGQPRSSTSRGENALRATHTAVPSPCALDRHPVTSLLWPQSSLFGLTP